MTTCIRCLPQIVTRLKIVIFKRKKRMVSMSFIVFVCIFLSYLEIWLPCWTAWFTWFRRKSRWVFLFPSPCGSVRDSRQVIIVTFFHTAMSAGRPVAKASNWISTSCSTADLWPRHGEDCVDSFPTLINQNTVQHGKYFCKLETCSCVIKCTKKPKQRKTCIVPYC